MKKIAVYLIVCALAVYGFMTGCKDNTPKEEPAVPYSALVSIPAGVFMQDDGTNSFEHTISAFRIGKYEVTFDLWYSVYSWAVTHDYFFQSSGREGNDGPENGTTTNAKYEPATYLSWRDAIVWCNAYSEKSGLTPCYTYLSEIIRDSRDANATACDSAVCVWANNGYRLPTEGEWQYAAAWKGADSANGAIEYPAGSGKYWTPYNYASGATADYTDAAATSIVAWYQVNTSGTRPVGGKTANALLLNDMSGNVMEWCWDKRGVYPGTYTDYRGPDTGTNRVTRGGGYFFIAIVMRLGFRNDYLPTEMGETIGLRVARKQ